MKNTPFENTRLAKYLDQRILQWGACAVIDGTAYDNPVAKRLLVDGAFVNVQIEALEPTLQVLVPQAALQRDQRGEFVLVVNDQQMVEQRYIVTGPQEGTAIVVEDGLREGESVIVEGLQRVRPGVPVDAVLAGTAEEG